MGEIIFMKQVHKRLNLAIFFFFYKFDFKGMYVYVCLLIRASGKHEKSSLLYRNNHISKAYTLETN
jgi:hypothetical protein